ncbi:hypothetical protein LCGC14_2172800 [marine sediment metagenome]|uniref:Uncharacterized protein n=1 Tax=marine sediment metagenome TaxID=412755 RepID=A0A0F9DPG0_9ZZZZ|nr:hypothetical protein [bacterium]
MATFYITPNLYPDNPHMFVVDVTQIVKIKGEPNTDFYRDYSGDHFWEVVIYTSGLDSDRSTLGPYWVDVIGSESDLTEVINGKLDEICSAIDWTKSPAFEDDLTEGTDTFPPYVYYQYPSPGQTNVPISSKIILRLREFLPAKGIDSSTVTMTIDGLSVIPDIYGNPYDTVFSYKPIPSA